MDHKICTCCKVGQPITAFHKSSREIDGLQGWCKTCFSKKNAQYRAANKEKDKLRHREYQQQNKDKGAVSTAKYRDRHPDRIREAVKRHYNANKEKENKRARDYYQANAERIRALKVKLRIENKEHRRAYESQYSKENKGLINAKTTRRRCAKAQAIPKWVNHEKIAAIYFQCTELTIETGVEHHVDHIVPLRSTIVCGLHWENNLQILTKAENSKKGNRSWPNMP